MRKHARPLAVTHFLRRRSPHSRGQAVVELALILPVILLLFASALDLGRLFYSQITINDAAREGVLEASRNPSSFIPNTACTSANKDSNRVMCRTLNEAKGGFVTVLPADVTLTCSTVTCPPTSAALGNTVSIKVAGRFTLITPLLSVFFGGQQITFSSTSSAQILVAPTVSATGPIAAFTVSPTTGVAPVAATVTDASTNSPSSWSWGFGDGATATGQAPAAHTYASAGTYTITLTVANSNGTSTATQTVTVSAAPVPTPTPVVPAAPVAAFTLSPSSGSVPFAVSVTNTSTGAPTSWAWTYGDGGTANVQAPAAHTYSVAGSYNITLTVTNAGGSNSVSHPVNAAAPCPVPVAIFSVNPTSGTKNSTNFVVTNSSTGMSTAGCNNIWSWNFGDGSGQSSVQSPAAYQYNKKGSYTITLTASNTGGTSTVTHDVDVSN